MADEMTVPLLPCADIDIMDDFYTALGFRRTYRQTRPNPYVAMQREDLHLHFFGMPGFEPADSYSTCLVLVPDIATLHREFAEGLRARYGRVPLSGIPRMTRPRPRKNDGGVAGFSVVDPGGNWIRITARNREAAPEPTTRLAVALANAVVLADSRGDHRQAARVLDTAIRTASDPTASDPTVSDPTATDPTTGTDDLAEVLLYRAELARTLADPETARTALDRLETLHLTAEQRARSAELRAS